MTSVATSGGGPLAPIQEAFAQEEATFKSDPLVMRGEALSCSPDEDEAAFSERRVAIVDTQGLHAMGELAGSLSYLWVLLDAPSPQHRGRLGLYIEEAIEQQLEKRGALPPGIQASTGLDASLSDQLYRARFVEMRGIALGIPSLEGITNLGRSLDAEDSAVLRWWIAAAADRPVHLVISNENTKLRVYPSPVLFESLFEVAPAPVTPIPPSPSMAASSQSMDLSDLPPEVELTNVLGTQVAPLGEQRSTDGFAADTYDDEYDQDPSLGVDLPELDRALGLAQAVEPTPNKTKVSARSDFRLDESPQLPLDYASPIPDLANTRKDGTPIDIETLNGRSPPSAEDVPSANAKLDVPHHPAAESLIADGLAELDEDEFLKTLKEDSARAPQVDVNEANDLSVTIAESFEQSPEEVKAPETTPQNKSSDILKPLPTKKIVRSPFIRLANPAHAISDSVEEDLEAGPVADPVVADELPSEPASEPTLPVGSIPVLEPLNVTLAGAAAPDPNVQALLNATLAGAAAPDPNDPFNQLAAREWKTWVANLEAARGPKPLSVIERMFVTDYTRLREAVRRGVASPSANGILDEWRESFSKSYSQAFEALRARGKRPTMVLDIVEMAARLGRLQGAKRVQLLLVDGLRFDLGLMVQDRMRQTADASLVERLLLWSALPSVTQYQLELLGKGPDGLKEPGVSDEPPALVARGPAARVPRRVRTGRVELFKLDVVEDCLREVGLPVLERMDSIADQTAKAITEFLSKQPPRTMVVAFGDHGFALDPKKAGTTAEVVSGGSSPEEVLVPAFAWLTGAVH